MCVFLCVCAYVCVCVFLCLPGKLRDKKNWALCFLMIWRKTNPILLAFFIYYQHAFLNLFCHMYRHTYFAICIGTLTKIRPILQFHWLSITSSLFWLVHQYEPQQLRSCIMWARESGRVRSSLRGTISDRLSSLKGVNLVLVLWAWSLTKFVYLYTNIFWQ